jgi:cytidylate kinase
MDLRLKIAIDGPAASGKSTTARLVADRLNYLYVDTGAMYRALTLAVIRRGIDTNDEQAIIALAERSSISLSSEADGTHTFLNGSDVSEDIRKPEITEVISVISAYAPVRELMVDKQRQLARNGGVVMEGRDIGSHVLPDAHIKVYMVAGLHERAERRYKELEKKGVSISLSGIEQDIRRRDELDSSRATAPLKAAPDAILLDTSNLTIQDQVNRVMELIRKYISEHK